MRFKKFSNGFYYLVNTRNEKSIFRAYACSRSGQQISFGNDKVSVPNELWGKKFKLKVELVEV